MAVRETRKRLSIDWNKVIQGALVPVIAAAVLALGAFAWTSFWAWFEPPHSQNLTWQSGNGSSPGIKIWGGDKDSENFTKFLPWAYPKFIPWSDLRIELELLLPKLFKDPSGYRFAVQDFHGKKNHVVKIVGADDKGFCYVWFGTNPDKGGEFDGLVRIGGDKKLPHVWQTYQRYSNGTYRRLLSAFATLDEACPPPERPCIYE